ncbi:hypothetical protein NM688_g7172 [Phlebia brevispora]|uniref:Uncharacterized protein n=1 Tax=Phlebia brevispora TaxID=194682 RepID=A0ACC1S8A2_9APHY|nr:hypothetical protein NM688_g7172 [Phlebia brevispora]
MYRLPHVKSRALYTASRVSPFRPLSYLSLKSLPRSFHLSSAIYQDASEQQPALKTGSITDPASCRTYQAHTGPFPARTHHCGGLSAKDAGSKVVLTGWLLPGRKVGKGFYFFPLKDSYGTIQLVLSGGVSPGTLDLMRDTPAESTVLVEGIVNERPANQKRPQQGGDIEVSVTSFILLNPAARDLPFAPSDTRNLPNEEHRLRYRYLDLRRPVLSSNLHKRSEVAHIIRSTLHENGFVEVETPILLKSTPEGAREFLVPTRLSSASPISSAPSVQPSSAPQPLFYALPQSPQQPKQLLIASGAVDRYYQIARCFRDEDGRKDRQPEFTQVDLEMAWVSWGSLHAASKQTDSWRIGGAEVRTIVQTLIRNIWHKIEGIELPEQFRVMTYGDAMGRFGSDKPDTRFGLELRDVTPHLPVQIREALSQRDEIVEALVVPASDETFRRAAAEMQPQESGITRIDVAENGLRIKDDNRLLDPPGPDALAHALALQQGDTVWLARRTRIPEGGSTILGRLRLAIASLAQSSGDLTLPPAPHFLWVTEFPLFTHADSDKEFLAHGRWSSSHHPFTAPMWEDIEKMYAGQIAEVRGQHYDLVLNGTEIGGGSVRVHDPIMQEHIFSKILQLDDTEKSTFNHLLNALRYGAPPHGGIALGFDRLMAILCRAESIRDVIAFPKTGAGTDLLFRSPAPSSDSVLEQYNIRTR